MVVLLLRHSIEGRTERYENWKATGNVLEFLCISARRWWCLGRTVNIRFRELAAGFVVRTFYIANATLFIF